MDSLVDNFLYYSTYKLSAIKRYNNRHFISAENVLEHTGSVGLISLVLSNYFNTIGIKNSTEMVLKMALIHDLPETLSGDIVHPAKYHYGKLSDNLRNSIEMIEDYSMENMISMIDSKKIGNEIGNNLMFYYKTYKKRVSIESKIVKLADMYSVILYAKKEISIGNNSMVEEIANAKKVISKILETI